VSSKFGILIQYVWWRRCSVEQLITNHSELRERGFRALADTLGWVNAVRFLREYDPGSGNYTEERSTLLPDLSVEELTAEIARIQEEKGFGEGPSSTDATR
jgi:hypothetical protein